MITGKHAMIVGVVALMVAVLGVIGIIQATGDALEDDHIFLGSPNDIAVQEIIPDCDTTTSHKLQYDQATNTLGCDSTAPGSSVTTQEDNADDQATSQIDYTNGLDRTFAAGEAVLNVDITKATNPVALTDDNTWIGSATADAAEEAFPDCDDSGGNHLNYDTTTNALSCGTSSSGGGGGDEIEVEDGDNLGTFTAVDTTAQFEDSADINFTHVDGGAGGPDQVTGTVRANAVALGTDTTGAYVATIADAGNSNIIVVGSGSETAAVTLDVNGALVRSATQHVCASNALDQLSCDFVGDGTDDDVQINAAIDACPAGFCSISLSEGTFTLGTSSAQVFASVGGYNLGIDRGNLELIGQGPGKTFLVAGDPDLNLVGNTVADLDYISIRDMTLDHDAVGNGSVTEGRHILSLYQVNKVWLDNLALLNSAHHGVATLPDTETAVDTDYLISNIYGENIGALGFSGGDLLRIFFGAENTVINNVIANGVELHAIHIGEGKAIVSNVVARNVGDAVVTIQSEGAIVSNIDATWDFISDLAANRPAAGTQGNLFFATDTTTWSRDNGTAWQTLAGAQLQAVEISTRPTYSSADHIAVSNIKAKMTVTENVTYAPTAVNPAILVGNDQSDITISDFHIDGKFYVGILVEEGASQVAISNGLIEGTLRDAIQVGAAVGTTQTGISVVGVTAKDVGQATADTHPAFFFRATVAEARIEASASIGTQQRRGIQMETGSSNILASGNYVEAAQAVKILDQGTGNLLRHNLGHADPDHVLPFDAAPTTDATAEIALDTTITDHQPLIQYFDGAENMTVIAIDTAELPAVDDEIVKYDAATDKFVLETETGVTLVSDPGGTTATTTSESGLELVSGALSMLRGCSNGQIEKWVSATESWDCSADSTGGTPSFDNITTGANTTATMTVGSGASMVLAIGGHIESSQSLNSGNNDTGATLFECTAVFISAFDIPSDLPEFAIADADLAANMPAIGLMHTDVTNGSDGFIITRGQIDGLDTMTGESWAVGESVYVNDSGTSASSDCGNTLTNVKPTNVGDFIQAIAIVERVHATNGRLKVIGAGRLNDLTILDENGTWIGSATNVATVTTVPDCDDTGGNHLNFDQTAKTFSCGTSDSGVVGFDAITSGTNTTATMTVGSGASIMLGDGGVNEASLMFNNVNNDSGVTLFECTAVYISAFDAPSDLPEILIADADNSAAMPAVGLIYADVTNGSNGFVAITGQLDGLDTATGESWVVGNMLYINDSGTSASTDCGNTLTNVRPANSDDFIQSVATVERVHATNGRLKILGASRVNDVPNIADDNTWVGSTTNVATSTAITDCDDAGSQVFTYDTATNAFGCGSWGNNNISYTAEFDAGGATSFEVPNGAGGTTVNAAGEVTVDTTSDTFNFYDGTNEEVLNPIKCGGITIENPTSSEDISMTFTPFAVTITEMRAVLIGSATPSVTWTVRHGTDRSAAGAQVVTGGTTTTSVTTGSDVTTFNDATIVLDSFIWLETTAQSGTVTELHVTTCFHQDG